MLLWDAAMARMLVRSLENDPERLLVHVCGSFHCEKRVGIVEMVQAMRGDKATRQLVIVMYPEADCHTFVQERHLGRGDYVILTDASVSRSHDYMQNVQS